MKSDTDNGGQGGKGNGDKGKGKSKGRRKGQEQGKGGGRGRPAKLSQVKNQDTSGGQYQPYARGDPFCILWRAAKAGAYNSFPDAGSKRTRS